MTCIIIGGNAAGMSAASRLKRKSPGARVIVFERTGEVSYGACGMPYYIAGFNDSLDKMRIRKPEAFLEQGIDLRLHATVTGIDAVNRRVLWRDAAGDCAAEAYDQLDLLIPPGPFECRRCAGSPHSFRGARRVYRRRQPGRRPARGCDPHAGWSSPVGQ